MSFRGGPVHLSPRWGLGVGRFGVSIHLLLRPDKIGSVPRIPIYWEIQSNWGLGVAVIRAAPFYYIHESAASLKTSATLTEFHSKARGNVRTHRR